MPRSALSSGRSLPRREPKSLGPAALLFSLYGLGALVRFPRLARAGKALHELRPDDFYLSNIAVTPEHRGCGAGTALLSAGEASAARGGAERIVLDVEEGNERARAFYGRSGYRFVSRVAIDLGRRGSFRFLRLAKDLGVEPEGTLAFANPSAIPSPENLESIATPAKMSA